MTYYNISSIGDGGIGPLCAETTTQKKCAETTTQKKTGLNRKKWEKWEMEKWESVTKMKKTKTLKEILIL